MTSINSPSWMPQRNATPWAPKVPSLYSEWTPVAKLVLSWLFTCVYGFISWWTWRDIRFNYLVCNSGLNVDTPYIYMYVYIADQCPCKICCWMGEASNRTRIKEESWIRSFDLMWFDVVDPIRLRCLSTLKVKLGTVFWHCCICHSSIPAFLVGT